MPTDKRASALARRAAPAKRTHLRTLAGRYAQFFTPHALAHIAELERETPAEPLTYTLAGLAAALNVSAAAVLANLRRGTIPVPDRIVGGGPRWLAASIDPILARLGRMPLNEPLRADGKQAMRDALRRQARRATDVE